MQLESERRRVEQEEEEKWRRKIEQEKEEGERRIEEEEKRIEAKIKEVKDALAQKYEEGFRPLIEEAENQHKEELHRVAQLEQELEEKQKELQSAEEEAKNVARQMTPERLYELGISDDSTKELQSGAVPEWKLREFESLKAAVSTLWEELDVPDQEIVDFLSAADLAAPYDPKVLNLYKEMHSQLINALSEPVDSDISDGSKQAQLSSRQPSPEQSPQQTSPASNLTSNSRNGSRSPEVSPRANSSSRGRPHHHTASPFEQAYQEQLSARTQTNLTPSQGGAGHRLYKSPTASTQRRQATNRKTHGRLKW